MVQAQYGLPLQARHVRDEWVSVNREWADRVGWEKAIDDRRGGIVDRSFLGR
jgi:hypothetical protein